jgi:Asp-tRNA(Asn)/Glu-tRNA(Gln) amidotransferase A subunit family amidase
MPVGLQLLGRSFEEMRLLQAAAVLERALDLGLRPPDTSGSA